MKKKNYFIISVVVIFLLIFAYLFFFRGVPSSPGSIHEVILGESGFTPQSLSIKKGDAVTFRTTLPDPFWPASDLHPTHGIYPEFDPQEPIEASSSWQFTFDKKGAWKYHDHLNPFYRATIIVE